MFVCRKEREVKTAIVPVVPRKVAQQTFEESAIVPDQSSHTAGSSLETAGPSEPFQNERCQDDFIPGGLTVDVPAVFAFEAFMTELGQACLCISCHICRLASGAVGNSLLGNGRGIRF